MNTLFRSLVALMLLAPACALAQAPKNPTPPRETQAAFDGFIAKFRAALKANYSATVAGMTKLPFMGEKTNSDAAQFRANAYPQFLTAKNRACLQKKKAVYDRDGDGNDNFFIFCGESIFTFTKTPSGFLFTDVGAND